MNLYTIDYFYKLHLATVSVVTGNKNKNRKESIKLCKGYQKLLHKVL